MSLSNLGTCGFDDSCAPLKGKSEWGMDTLTRKLIGARSLATAFNLTLAQGQAYQFYYLQTWDWDDNPNVATVTLNYKGLLPGGTPAPDIQTEVASAVGRTTKDYSTENDGIGRLYNDAIISQPGAGEIPIDPPPGFLGGTVQYRVHKYAVGATMQFNYKAMQVQIRYISIGQPSGPIYSAVNVHFDPSFDNARITTSDGATFGIDRMTFFELEPVQLPARAISFNSKNVIGSPYWEGEEILRLELGTLS